MSSINEWKRRNKSLDAINKQLSDKILVLEAEIEQLKKRAALDEDFSKYIDSRDELMARKDEYIQTLAAENKKLKGERDELEKSVKTWQMQAEKTAKEYRAMEKKMEEQESKLADISDRYIYSEINGAIEKENYKEKYESLKKNIKRDDNNRIETKWMVNYAKEKPESRSGATAIRDMLTDYYLSSEKMPQADAMKNLREINKIPEEYDANHPRQPLISSADQVVVNNHGTVEHQ